MRHFRQFFVYFLLSGMVFGSSWAADFPRLKKLFETTWNSVYVENRCGENIEKLVSLALDSGIDLHGVEIVGLEDKSGWMFGMVNALMAREGGRLIQPQRVQPPFRVPGEKNWHFHVFLLVNGMVMDYDFTNHPRVVPAITYFHEMYLPREKWNDVKYKTSKMGLYQLERYPAEDYILRLRQRLSRKEIAVTQKLKDYMPGFFMAR